MSTIAQNLQTIATAKADIATSVNAKGGNITSSTPLSAYSAAIDALPSGGGGGEPDWSEIGYSGAPQNILDAFDYSKTIYANWDDTQTNLAGKFSGDTQLIYMPLVDTSSATNMSNMLSGCTRLEYMPLINTSGVTDMGSMFRSCSKITTIPQLNTSACTSMLSMFRDCSNLTTIPQLNTSNVEYAQDMFYNCSSLVAIPLLDTSKVKDMGSMFRSCSKITTIPQLNTSACTNMPSMFYGCTHITTIPQLNTSGVTDMGGMFQTCSSLGKIEGLDFTSYIYDSSIFGTSNNNSIKYALFKNIGTPSGRTTYQFNRATNWGVADSTYTDARDSLVDSLLTYSFDRATAGYSTCTIKLSSNSKNQLTAQEISDIEAKGYTITT